MENSFSWICNQSGQLRVRTSCRLQGCNPWQARLVPPVTSSHRDGTERCPGTKGNLFPVDKIERGAAQAIGRCRELVRKRPAMIATSKERPGRGRALPEAGSEVAVVLSAPPHGFEAKLCRCWKYQCRRATAMPNRKATNRLASGAWRVIAATVDSALPGRRASSMVMLSRSTAARSAPVTSPSVRETSVAVSIARSAIPGCGLASNGSSVHGRAFAA